MAQDLFFDSYKIFIMKQVLLLLILFILSFTAFASGSILERGDFEKAQLKAKTENKLLFLDFYASWCTPCKWMDETTFQDAEVLSILNQKFIAVKVNIDDFEGFELKSKFDIRYLPTMLIFNQNGVLIERVEETLGVSKMKNLLNESTANIDMEVIHAVNSSPSQIFSSDKKLATSSEENKTEENEVTTSDIKEYKIQVGVFASVQNAIKMQKNLKKRFTESVIISEVKINGSIKYKVLMGSFKNLGDAESYQTMLKKDFKIESIIL